MGREIRKVPAGWEHPRNARGHYIPLFDRDYESERAKWVAENATWENGTHPDIVRDPTLRVRYPLFAQWHGEAPDPESHRPAWPDAERTHFQVYETVSEGTPASPVFASLDDVETWLREQGHSAEAARSFARTGFAPSFVVMNGVVKSGIDALPDLRNKE